MSKPTVYPLFSTPVYVRNVGDFEKPDLQALEYSSNIPTGGSYNFRSSVDKKVLERPEFQHIHGIVLREIELYTRELLAVNNSIQFYVTNSWVNAHRHGHSAGA